jgi:hypothetical protein
MAVDNTSCNAIGSITRQNIRTSSTVKNSSVARGFYRHMPFQRSIVVAPERQCAPGPLYLTTRNVWTVALPVRSVDQLFWLS